MNNTESPPDALPSRPRWTFVLLLYPFLLWGLLASGHAIAEWIGLFSLGVLILLPPLLQQRAWAWLSMIAVGLIAAYATANGNRALVNYLPQILIGLFLLVLFGRTLRPGSVPLITRIATAMRQGRASVPERYTRGVTILWVVLFAMILLEGILMTLFAPGVSFGWVSAATYSTVGIVMVAEYLFHTWRYPDPAQQGFADFMRQLIQIDYRRLMND